MDLGVGEPDRGGLHVPLLVQEQVQRGVSHGKEGNFSLSSVNLLCVRTETGTNVGNQQSSVLLMTVL